MPPVGDTGGGYGSPFRVTLIAAVSLVGAAVALLTFFYLLRAYQQARPARALPRCAGLCAANAAAPRCAMSPQRADARRGRPRGYASYASARWSGGSGVAAGGGSPPPLYRLRAAATSMAGTRGRAPRGRAPPSRYTWWRWWSPAARWTSALLPAQSRTQKAMQATMRPRPRLLPRRARPTSVSTPSSPRPMLLRHRRGRHRQRSRWRRLRRTTLRRRETPLLWSGGPRIRALGRCCSSRACATRLTAWALRCARGARRGGSAKEQQRHYTRLCPTQRLPGCALRPRWAKTARCASRSRARPEQRHTRMLRMRQQALQPSPALRYR